MTIRTMATRRLARREASALPPDQPVGTVSANFTQEIFQPDEILAQNFALAATQPSLGILQDIQRALATAGSGA